MGFLAVKTPPTLLQGTIGDFGIKGIFACNKANDITDGVREPTYILVDGLIVQTNRTVPTRLEDEQKTRIIVVVCGATHGDGVQSQTPTRSMCVLTFLTNCTDV